MAKRPRDLHPDRLLRFLARQGWPVVREGARHAIVAREGKHVAVPRHGPLKTGTLAAILKECSIEDWGGL